MYAKHVSRRVTSQSKPVPGKNQVPNSAGGYTFQTGNWLRLDRFLILGCEQNTYYTTAKKLTQENAQCVYCCAQEDGPRTVQRVVEISLSGRAPRNDPAIFALAFLSSCLDPTVRALALSQVSQVCRTGTHLFQFAASCRELRGWGRGLRQAVGRWYLDKDPRSLLYQVTKYQQRNGWSHRDLLRLAHPKTEDPLQNSILKYVTQGVIPEVEHEIRTTIEVIENLKKETSPQRAARLIREQDLPREVVPTPLLNHTEVWEALLEHMPMTALIRNLATMTRVGLITPLSEASQKIHQRLLDPQQLRQARIHPLPLLMALRTYESGHGDKSNKTWKPDQTICSALEEAFYLAFDQVEPTQKRWFFGIDVSGSMTGLISGTSMSCCEAATALALVGVRSEPFSFVGRFNNGIESCPFNRRTRLEEALRYIRSINCGGTNCALPMIYARERRIPVDVFVVLTDNETWAGAIHPFQALQQYRQSMGIPAKLIVVGMTATEFTLADPDDPGSLDVCGFDTSVPTLMSDFVRN